MGKKSFTLIEMLISITLFSIIIIFLYDTLDLSKKANKFFYSKLELSKEQVKLKKLFFEDIINSDKNTIIIHEDKNKNSILSMKSNNIFHNNFNNYITYFISKENNLLRIEHKKMYKTKNNFRNNKQFIDKVLKKIDLFKVKKIANKEIVISIKSKKVTKMYLLLKL